MTSPQLRVLEAEFRRVGVIFEQLGQLGRLIPEGSLAFEQDAQQMIAILRTLPDGAGQVAVIKALAKANAARPGGNSGDAGA